MLLTAPVPEKESNPPILRCLDWIAVNDLRYSEKIVLETKESIDKNNT
jgi:hypothetical protein